MKSSSVHCEGLLRWLLPQHPFCYRDVEFLQHLLLFSRASRPGMAAGPCTAFPQYLLLSMHFFPSTTAANSLNFLRRQGHTTKASLGNKLCHPGFSVCDR